MSEGSFDLECCLQKCPESYPTLINNYKSYEEIRNRQIRVQFFAIISEIITDVVNLL